MPSLSDVLTGTKGLEGYAPVAPPLRPTAPFPPSSPALEPVRNAMLRCPMPVLWQSTPDALRQFYMGGQVPQDRIMLPQATGASQTTATVTQTVQIAGSTSGSGSSSTSPHASAAVVSTPVLPPGNRFAGTVLLAKSFQLLAVTAQRPCRVQLYGTAAAQSADSSRSLDAPPAAGTAQNIICDVVLDTAPYNWSFQNRIGANADTSQSTKVYVTITNLDQSSRTETVTVQYVSLESNE